MNATTNLGQLLRQPWGVGLVIGRDFKSWGMAPCRDSTSPLKRQPQCIGSWSRDRAAPTYMQALTYALLPFIMNMRVLLNAPLHVTDRGHASTLFRQKKDRFVFRFFFHIPL